MSAVGENVVVMMSGNGLVGKTVEATQAEKVRVSRRDRRLVRAAFGIIAALVVVDAVLYLGRFV